MLWSNAKEAADKERIAGNFPVVPMAMIEDLH